MEILQKGSMTYKENNIDIVLEKVNRMRYILKVSLDGTTKKIVFDDTYLMDIEPVETIEFFVSGFTSLVFNTLESLLVKSKEKAENANRIKELNLKIK